MGLGHLGFSSGQMARRGRVASGVTVNQDGPSNVYVPSSAADWTALGLSSPGYQWNCQESSGDLTDVIAGIVLTANASPLYQRSVAGWTRKFVGTLDATTSQGFRNTATAALDLAAGESYAMLAYAAIAFPVTATRRWIAMSESVENVTISTGAVIQPRHNSVGVNSVQTYNDITAVRPFILYRNATADTSGLLSDREQIVNTHNESAFAGGSRAIGAHGLTIAPTTRFGLCAIWKGAAAESIATKAALQTLGWTVLW